MKTCVDDDVDLDDISCKYWVVTIRINLPKISLGAWPFRYSVSFSGQFYSLGG